MMVYRYIKVVGYKTIDNGGLTEMRLGCDEGVYGTKLSDKHAVYD